MTKLINKNEYDILKVFEDYLGVFVEDGDLKQKSFESYIYHLEVYFKYCYEQGIDPKLATQQDLRGYRSYLRENYKASTIQLKFNILRRFYSRAIELGYRRDNPAKLKIKRDNPEDRIKYLSKTEIETLLQTFKCNTPTKIRDYAILYFLLFSGLRVVEITRLDLSDIGNNRLRVFGKNDKVRFVPLSAKAKEVLVTWLEVREEFCDPQELALFVSTSNNHRGERLSTRSIRYRVDHYLSRINAKEKGKSCHSLRHSCGTHLASKVPMKIIQSLLGHSTLPTTEIYGVISEREIIENNPSKILEDMFLAA